MCSTQLFSWYFYPPPDVVFLSCFCCERICAGCNMEIGSGRFLSCMNALWHPQCFRCRGCNQPISDYEVKRLYYVFLVKSFFWHIGQFCKTCYFSEQSWWLYYQNIAICYWYDWLSHDELNNSSWYLCWQFSVSGNYPYHKTCYKESHHPKCDVCRHFVSISTHRLSYSFCLKMLRQKVLALFTQSTCTLMIMHLLLLNKPALQYAERG